MTDSPGFRSEIFQVCLLPVLLSLLEIAIALTISLGCVLTLGAATKCASVSAKAGGKLECFLRLRSQHFLYYYDFAKKCCNLFLGVAFEIVGSFYVVSWKGSIIQDINSFVLKDFYFLFVPLHSYALEIARPTPLDEYSGNQGQRKIL